MWNIKNTVQIFLQNRNKVIDIENTYMVTKGIEVGMGQLGD